jgi:hypothetical protein
MEALAEIRGLATEVQQLRTDLNYVTALVAEMRASLGIAPNSSTASP